MPPKIYDPGRLLGVEIFFPVIIEGLAARPNFNPMKGSLFLLCFPFLHAFIAIACLCNPEDLCPCVQPLLHRSARTYQIHPLTLPYLQNIPGI